MVREPESGTSIVSLSGPSAPASAIQRCTVSLHSFMVSGAFHETVTSSTPIRTVFTFAVLVAVSSVCAYAFGAKNTKSNANIETAISETKVF